jgi:hypothetical protein
MKTDVRTGKPKDDLGTTHAAKLVGLSVDTVQTLTHKAITRGMRLLALTFALTLPALTSAQAMATNPADFIASSLAKSKRDTTHLIDLTYGAGLSGRARTLQIGGYETSDGQWVSFDPWYRTSLRDWRATWLTELTPHWGLIWGMSTGEVGRKYKIEPSFKLGLVMNQPVNRHANVSFMIARVFWGHLKEKTCLAAFGELGSESLVNCRLAATPLPPSETLKYLLHESPTDSLSATVRYTLNF